jgi:hypothetical protein
MANAALPCGRSSLTLWSPVAGNHGEIGPNMTSRLRLLALVVVAVAGACRADKSMSDGGGAEHLEWYGFVGVMCDLDDPLDDVRKTNYLDEVAGFTNLAHLCPNALDVSARLQELRDAGVKAAIDMTSVFFERAPGPSPSGAATHLVLSPKAAANWASFRAANAGRLGPDYLAAYYLVDEPVWQGASAGDIEAAAALLDAHAGQVPILIVEAHQVIDRAVFPRTVDWVGFDRYGTRDPRTDPKYQADLAMTRARRTRADQRLVLVLEAQWYPFYADHGAPPEYMATVAMNYHAAAKTDLEVVGLVGYLWPGGLSGAGHRGARDLPASVKAAYVEIGRAITGKASP